MTTDPSRPPPAPFLRVVRGEPTPEETAALVAVLTARARAARAAGDEQAPGPPSGWRDRSRLLGLPPAPGPGAWRAAYRPR
ncbi:acyl-CoA dehydrogenase [Streptomonospora alba]|uniref:Acyl-CoA dehydrogenase n=1 Tax=Streptomonospora alba TaxID=183763 RepID=A0A0C2FD04_9ACTN|nr:acyl-CoA carboxylase subunit epsilon [Streptomonospora alba]KIH97039.1 acyl-CoA dehydrogenase [Streptomonospora alba]